VSKSGGTAAIGFSIAFEMSANRNAKEAIVVYNRSKRQDNTSLGLGFISNGMMIGVNF